MLPLIVLHSGLNSGIWSNHQSAFLWSKLDNGEGEGEVQTRSQEEIRSIDLGRRKAKTKWTEWDHFKDQIQQAERRVTDLSDHLEAQSWRKQLRFDQSSSLQQRIRDSKCRIDEMTEAIEAFESKPSAPTWWRLESARVGLLQQVSILSSSSSSSSSIFGLLSQLTTILSNVVSSGMQLLITAGVIAASVLSGSWVPSAAALFLSLLLGGAFLWSQLIEQEEADQTNLTEALTLIQTAWRKVTNKMNTLHLMQMNEKLDYVVRQLCSRPTAQASQGVSVDTTSTPLNSQQAKLQSSLQSFAKEMVREGLVNENMSFKDMAELANLFKQEIQTALEEQEQAQAHSTNSTQLENKAASQHI